MCLISLPMHILYPIHSSGKIKRLIYREEVKKQNLNLEKWVYKKKEEY